MKPLHLIGVMGAALLAGTFPGAGGDLWAAQKESKEEKKLQERQQKLSKKEQERQAREGKARAQETKKYNTLREFAEDLYASDPDFKDMVEDVYRDLQGSHALQAFRINTSRGADIIQTEDEGDVLKIRRALYDNPRVQDYVNRVGQRLVPADSEKLYAFKVVLNPIPSAYTLSTGTVLISTGMISMLDNEAQLAYVLAHELAHVYKDHWKIKAMMPLAEEEFNKRQEKRRAMWAGLFALGGAAVGGAAKGGTGAGYGAMIGALAGYAIGSAMAKRMDVDWFVAQENEADDFALKIALEKSYDVQEVPKLYAAMEQTAKNDARTQLGFLGQRKRLRERAECVQKLLQGPTQNQYQQLLKEGKLVGTSAEYNLVMAELKRDNGIQAFYFDMFEMARRNLQQAVSLRSDDPRATFYYGRVLKLVAHSKEEMQQAQQYLLTAIRLDAPRPTLPLAQLYRALYLMDSGDAGVQAEAVQALKDYIVAYQTQKVEEARAAFALPGNVEVIYDYLRLLGEKSWKPPVPDFVRVAAPVGSASTEAMPGLRVEEPRQQSTTPQALPAKTPAAVPLPRKK
jgi:predicted Zn-dependent protease